MKAATSMFFAFALWLAAFAGAGIAQTGEGEAQTDEAKAKKWTVKSDASLMVNQSATSDNWVGGDAGALSWALTWDTIAEKQLTGILFNKNTIRLAYGVTYNQDVETRKWGSGTKSADLVDLESTGRFTTGWWAEPIVALRGISRFVDESDPDKTIVFNPWELTESVGFTRIFVKEDDREFSSRLGVGARQQIDRNYLNVTTDTRETEAIYSGGIDFVTDVAWPFADGKIVYLGKLTVFQAVASTVEDNLKGTPEEDDWKHPDINWENTFTSNITKSIAVKLYVQLLYDRNIDKAARIRETLAFGLTYKLFG